VATIVDDAAPFAREAIAALAAAGLRVEGDLRNEKIDRKVPDHILARVPVLAAVGRRDAEQGTLTLRRLPGREQQALPLAEAVALLAAEARAPDQVVAGG
jgi:threonyl-tRNA synthetase